MPVEHRAELGKHCVRLGRAAHIMNRVEQFRHITPGNGRDQTVAPPCIAVEIGEAVVVEYTLDLAGRQPRRAGFVATVFLSVIYNGALDVLSDTRSAGAWKRVDWGK